MTIKIWGENALPGEVLAISDEDFLRGFYFFGDQPPTAEEFNWLVQQIFVNLKSLDETRVPYAGGSLTGALKNAPQVTIASVAGVLTLSNASNAFLVNGAEAINEISGWTQGIAIITWNTARTLNHSAGLVLKAGGAARTTAIGDVGIYHITAGVTTELFYMPAAGYSGGLNSWEPTTAYVVGDICYSSTAASYKVMECTVDGVSGANEPAWPAIGATVVDGTCQWKVCDIRQGTTIGRVPALVDVGGGVSGLPGVSGKLLTDIVTTPELYAYTITTTHPANTVSGSNTITITDSVVDVHPGQTVTGAGIPANTTITSVNRVNKTVVLSNNATATGNGVTLTFTKADGIYTHTVPTGKSVAEVIVTGGGGGGSGTPAINYMSTSGSAAGTAIKIIPNLISGANVPITVGAGGAAAGSANASDGGASSFGTYCSADSGKGGRYGGSVAYPAGGNGVNGDINLAGGDAFVRITQSDGDDHFTGGCPASYWGGGSTYDIDARAYGSGGGNAANGAQGIVVVKYY